MGSKGLLLIFPMQLILGLANGCFSVLSFLPRVATAITVEIDGYLAVLTIIGGIVILLASFLVMIIIGKNIGADKGEIKIALILLLSSSLIGYYLGALSELGFLVVTENLGYLTLTTPFRYTFSYAGTLNPLFLFIAGATGLHMGSKFFRTHRFLKN